ncbi:MAG: nucleotidyltransferase family protein [Clostridia bacterium]|nr:nucleotidyltransferase family protein [Clostridia bacterium]
MNLELYVSYITELISSFLKNENIKPLPSGIDINYFFSFCKFHRLENIVYLALKNTDIPKELRSLFEKSYFVSINHMAKQQYYMEKVEKAFEDAGIDYFVMKGKELSGLYPSEDMRISSDFDMYIGNEKAELARDIMVNLGFTIKDYMDDDGHDQYVIDKTILCELHRVLIQSDFPWKNECNNIAERVIKCEGNNHRYKMRIEDFYIYNLAHAANHIKTAGVGIRIYTDLWLIYTKYQDTFDYSYLNEKLRLANLTRFEECSRELYLYWFEGKTPIDSTVMAMAIFVAQSGWMGTYNQYSSAKLAQDAKDNSSSTATKIKSYLDIIFPTYKNLVKRYPNAKKHKVLIPFYYIYRIFKSVFGKDKGAKRVINEITAGDLEKGKYILRLKKDMGL